MADLALDAAEDIECCEDRLETLLPETLLYARMYAGRSCSAKMLTAHTSIGERDAESAWVHIQPGAGGKDSMDWAGMLCGMYEKWSMARGFRCA